MRSTRGLIAGVAAGSGVAVGVALFAALARYLMLRSDFGTEIVRWLPTPVIWPLLPSGANPRYVAASLIGILVLLVVVTLVSWLTLRGAASGISIVVGVWFAAIFAGWWAGLCGSLAQHLLVFSGPVPQPAWTVLSSANMGASWGLFMGWVAGAAALAASRILAAGDRSASRPASPPPGP